MNAKPSTRAEHHDEVRRLRDRVAELEAKLRDQDRELKKLRVQTHRSREVFDSIHAIVWEADPTNWRFTSVSDHAHQITGYPVKEWYKPNFWPDHIHPDDRERAVSYCRSCTARGESHDFEYRMIAADGRTIWLRDLVTVIGKPGNPELLCGVMVDITRQRETEQQLRSHDQRLRLIANQMPAIIWSMDSNLRFTSSLGAGLARLGLEPNQVVGMSLEELFASDEELLALTRRQHERALAGESVQYTNEWAGNSYESRLEPLRDHEHRIIGVIGLALDVTERERTQRQHRESEQRWQSIFEHAIDPIWEWDIVADKAIWSPSWARILGYAPEEFDPDRITWVSLLHPEDKPRVLSLLGRYLRGEELEYVCEYRVRHRRGSWKWVFGRGVIAGRDEVGKPTRMIGYIMDVTERRQLEDALRHRIAAESLLATISSQFVNIESDRLDEAIDEALRRVGVFAGADRTYIFQFSSDGTTFTNTHEWCADGVAPHKPLLQDLSVDRCRWVMDQLRKLQPITIPDVSKMPDEAAFERELIQSGDVRSLIIMPMTFRGELKGFLGYDSVREPKSGRVERWSEEDVSLLGAMGSVFINAIERRRVEQAVIESERFLSTLMSNLPGWVYRCRNDRHWTYEYGSEGMKDVLGYPADVFMEGGGLKMSDLIHPDDRERVWHMVQEAVDRDEPFQLVYRTRDADGSEKWVWEQGRAIKDEDGNIMCLEGFVSDITERKKAEDELRRQEREFHAIVHNTPDIISRFDCNLRHVYVNPVVEPLTGHPPEVLLNKPVDELPWPESVRDQWRKALMRVIRERREKVIEFELDGAGGRMFLESRLVPELDDDGNVESILSIARNVTMRKRAELGLMRANETQRLLLRELDHRVRNNLASLSALIDITSRNATSITEFADSIRGRVQAMTAVHGLLSKGHWSSVSLHDLFGSLIPADLLKQFDLQGPEVLVEANQCTALGMVVQELIANSLKYGALQSNEGVVHVHWTCDESKELAAAMLNLRWRERGGPPFESVSKPGLGTNLIQGLVRTELRGSTTMDYPPEGATHEFHLELDREDE